MIHGIGTDIVRVERIQTLFDKYGERFAKRILTDNELRQFYSRKSEIRFLATRYAAKEAIAKAMGTGFRFGISLRHLGTISGENGKPEVEFLGKADEIRKELSIVGAFISIADEKEYAIAYATLTK